MQLTDTLATLMRRWYLVLAGLALTCGFGWLVYHSAPPQYDAEGSVLLMPSRVTVGAEGNPYLYLGGMNDALDVLVRRTNAPELHDKLLADYPGASFSIDRDSATQSPIIVSTVEARTESDALALLRDSLAALNLNLGSMQGELAVPEDRLITLRHLVVDPQATRNTKASLQMTIVAIGAGFVGTVMVTGLVDSTLIRRRLRPRSEHDATNQGSENDERGVQLAHSNSDPGTGGSLGTSQQNVDSHGSDPLSRHQVTTAAEHVEMPLMDRKAQYR